MNEVPANLRRQIVQRANNRCEYCRLSQEGQEAAFHVDHIRPSIAGGATHIDNLALACVSCSLRKGARQTGFDLENDNEATIFHPRIENWHAHFRWDGEVLIGITSIGRATISALNMNRPLILAIRREEVLRGRHP